MIRLVRGWMRGDCWVPTLRHLKKASIQLGQSRFSFFAGGADGEGEDGKDGDEKVGELHCGGIVDLEFCWSGFGFGFAGSTVG